MSVTLILVRRRAFLAFWLGLTFLIAWFPPVNTAVKGDVPSRWDYDGPYTSIASQPSPTVSALATHRPAATVPPPTERPAASMSGHSITGVASWYCRPGVSRCTRGHPGGLYAAIRRDLLTTWRGRDVKVCTASNCVTVRVIDCLCAGGTGIIDLYADAFIHLAPLSRGRIHVTLYLLGLDRWAPIRSPGGLGDGAWADPGWTSNRPPMPQ